MVHPDMAAGQVVRQFSVMVLLPKAFRSVPKITH